jgi:RHS repeat-associated protein
VAAQVKFDYYPFGMIMPNRKFAAVTGYRYGFNGKENDNEPKGEGNQQDYGMRIYDPRLGRFLSVDPLAKEFPWYTPYQFAGNTPIQAIDLDGSEELHYTAVDQRNKTASITIQKNYEVVNTGIFSTTDNVYVNSQLAAAMNVFNNTVHNYRFVKMLPTSTSPLKQAGLFARLGFSIGNMFESKAEREANYKRKYWTVEARYQVTINNTPGMTDAQASTLINNNNNLNGKIQETAFPAASNAAAQAPVKVPNTSTNADDNVTLNQSYFGTPSPNRNILGRGGVANGGELIAHEIGHNLHPGTHNGTDGTSDSYPSSGIGSNVTGLRPSKDETKDIINNSLHTLPAVAPIR